MHSTLSIAVGGILALVGLAFAFWGRTISKILLTIIGAALGGVLGFLAGFAIGSTTLALVLSLVGALIGSILFGKLVKIALALVMGILAGALVFVAYGGSSGASVGDVRTLVAIVAFFAVFGVSYYFIEELLGIITAVIGGILVGIGAYLIFDGSLSIAGVAGAGIFVLGALMQTLKIRRQKRIAAAMAAVPPGPYPPPPPPPPPR